VRREFREAYTPAVDTTGEVIFMLLVLKIPMVYLGVVVWYSLKGDPAQEHGGGEGAGVLAPLTPCDWGAWRDRRLAGTRGRKPFRPAGRPGRAPVRGPRTAVA